MRFTQSLRGYKTSEVDWVLERLGYELDSLRGELAALRVAYGVPEDTPEDIEDDDVEVSATAGELRGEEGTS